MSLCIVKMCGCEECSQSRGIVDRLTKWVTIDGERKRLRWKEEARYPEVEQISELSQRWSQMCKVKSPCQVVEVLKCGAVNMKNFSSPFRRFWNVQHGVEEFA
jgi:hypothetical protein